MTLFGNSESAQTDRIQFRNLSVAVVCCYTDVSINTSILLSVVMAAVPICYR